MGRHERERQPASLWKWAVVVLPVLGLAVSSYLWRAKAGATVLVCGGLSDCISVNASTFSEIGGIPIAALGTGMYGVLSVAGALVYAGSLGTKVPVFPRHLLFPLAFTLALAGALYSLYLTGIEAFVLRAYCVWCLVSWFVITVVAIGWARLWSYDNTV